MSDNAPLYVIIAFISFFVIAIGAAAYNDQAKHDLYVANLDKLYDEKTCDEIPLLEYDVEYPKVDRPLVQERHETDVLYVESDRGWAARYYDKCMTDIFPDGYPTEIQLTKYFANLECEDLGTHVIKQKFEYTMAKNIYTVKCNTPLERIELPPIEFEQTEKPETKTEPIKSDYSNYGSQYKKWEKRK